ncbi:MAG: hypothetical protein HKO66_02775 [Saprospiraceae bacterium]|nr:hypothetical protein [Bacteroidia bacterium]NNE16433.1 hypothetical protein [Saprospiraceae bacterium]NNL91138.1 hypothetical protein [Saprospiraceae bacterium]
MHDIEPYFKWRTYYCAEEDKQSPFFGKKYSEFQFTQKVYNYFIHPQWDSFGSQTLYAKLLFVDYEESYAIIELIGEWNDCLNNDVMFLKRYFADHMIAHDISKFIIMCDNVLNFHGSDNCYYEEWWDDIKDEDGWVCFVNTLDHVLDEMEKMRIQHYCEIGDSFIDINWRKKNPQLTYQEICHIRQTKTKQLH